MSKPLHMNTEFIRIVDFDGFLPAAEFIDQFGTFRLNEDILRERIKNLTKYGLDATTEEHALLKLQKFATERKL